MYFRVNAFISGIVDQNDTECHFVKDLEHLCWCVCEEVSQDGFRICQVHV